MKIIATVSDGEYLVQANTEELRRICGRPSYMTESERKAMFCVGATIGVAEVFDLFAHVISSPDRLLRTAEQLRAEAERIEGLLERHQKIITQPVKPARG